MQPLIEKAQSGRGQRAINSYMFFAPWRAGIKKACHRAKEFSICLENAEALRKHLI
jgi:hypothetical protein